LLAIVCDTAPGRLQAPLTALVEAGILERHVTLGRETYSFSHVLVRDTAYGSLLRERRRQLHERVARALETLDPAGVARNPEVLALHLTESGAAEAAAPHWLEAARRSLARSSLTEAARMLRRALDGLEALPAGENSMALRIQVSALLGAALSGLKGPNSVETREHYTTAYDLCRQLPEDPSHFPIYWGWWRLEPASVERATVLLDRAAIGDVADHLLQAHHCNWCSHLNAGSLQRCCEHVEAGLAIYAAGDYAHHARTYGNHDPRVCAHGARAQAWWMQGKLRSAMDDEVQALSWASRLDHVGSRVHALGLTLLHRAYRRDFEAVFDRAEELIAFTSDHGLADHGAAGLIFRGWVVATQRDPAAGLAMLGEGLARQSDTATNEDYSVYLCLLAEALLAAGKPAAAAERLLRERPAFDSNGFRIWLPELVRMAGEAVIAADPSATDRAGTLFSEAAELAREQGANMIGLRIAASQGRLDLRCGETARAASRLRVALDAIVENDGSDDLVQAAMLCEVARSC
jgi:predicted ATPase